MTSKNSMCSRIYPNGALEQKARISTHKLRAIIVTGVEGGGFLPFFRAILLRLYSAK